MPLNIQCVSDLHIEFRPGQDHCKILLPVCDILVLAGDICPCNPIDIEIFKTFINGIISKYRMILFVAGNHERYNSPLQDRPYSIDEIDTAISKFCNSTNGKLVYMNNRALVIQSEDQQYLIIGSTLWTHVPVNIQPVLNTLMNDYTKIFIGDANKIQQLQSSYVNAMFDYNLKFIIDMVQLSKKHNMKTVLITHHQPYVLNPKGAISHGYMSDLTFLFNDIDLVLHGHTHIPVNMKIKKAKVYSNPLGYPGQNLDFKPDEKLTV